MTYVIKKIKSIKPIKTSFGLIRELTNSRDSKKLDFAHIIIKNSTENHYHKKTTEFYFVLSGEIKIEINKNTKHLKSGEMMIIYPNTKHRVWNVGGKKADILVSCSPPWTEDDEIVVK